MEPAAWVEPVPDAVVVRLGGEIDMATVADVSVALDKEAAPVPPGALLVVDARAVEFLSARGVRALAELDAELRQRGAELALVEPSRAVRLTFRAAGVLRLRDLVGEK